MEALKTTQPERRHPDAYRSKLRGILARIERDLPDTPLLQDAWRELGAALALGPEPATRVCPACGAVGMQAATRCGYCWASLVALPPPVTVG